MASFALPPYLDVVPTAYIIIIIIEVVSFYFMVYIILYFPIK